jgi:hypothetical protein
VAVSHRIRLSPRAVPIPDSIAPSLSGILTACLRQTDFGRGVLKKGDDMIRFEMRNTARQICCLIGVAGLVAFNAMAQYGGGGSTGGGGASGGGGSTSAATGGGVTSVYNFHGNYHVGFESPEGWGLKYFASTTLLNGLQPAEPTEGHRVGSISIALETGWLPTLDDGQRRIGFKGHAPEDLNKAPIFVRPVVRIGLPDKFTALIAAPPPFEVFGITPRLFAFGLERPLVQRDRWTLNWRGYGQLGWVRGAFTCPKSVLVFEPGSPANPTECVGESDDSATLRYAGMEFQVSRKISSMPKLTPHVAVAGNFIDGVFQVHAPVEDGLDQTRLWTRGGTFSMSGGASYRLTSRASFTVDAFYTPLWVQRNATAPRTNDGLFNIRALVNYTIR